jgi:hypothetical protein
MCGTGSNLVTIHVNNAGTWTVANEVYVNDAGTWREPQEIYINDAGVWRTVHKVVTVAANVNNLSLYSLAGSPTTAITLKVTVNAGVTITNWNISTSHAAIDISSFARGILHTADQLRHCIWRRWRRWVWREQLVLQKKLAIQMAQDLGVIIQIILQVVMEQVSRAVMASSGGPAIRINTNSTLRIENHGTIVGGGGGAGGDGGNNVGGGSGGNGGNALDQIAHMHQ